MNIRYPQTSKKFSSTSTLAPKKWSKLEVALRTSLETSRYASILLLKAICSKAKSYKTTFALRKSIFRWSSQKQYRHLIVHRNHNPLVLIVVLRIAILPVNLIMTLLSRQVQDLFSSGSQNYLERPEPIALTSPTN